VALVGPNATGKTTVLEAVGYGASLASHRTASDGTLVRQGCQAGLIRLAVERAGRQETLELEVVSQGRARTRLGGAPVARRRDVLGVVRAALFAPERVAAVRGEPADRRRLVDEVLVQLQPRYHAVLRDYDRVLRQRNALLREAEGRPPAGIEVWDEALAAVGGDVCAGRQRAVAALAPAAARAYRVVAEEDLSIRYASNVEAPPEASAEAWAEAIRQRIEERRGDELARGASLVGPHRDDLDLRIGELPTRSHASQGEAWLVALAVALGAREALSRATSEEALLLLDDAFTLLDGARRERVAAALPPGAQVLATAAGPADLPGSVAWTVLRVSAGEVRPRG
jgi:DNA replication and repair protein RecF